jgi:myo-inositol-1(or 4)-monophosphatase
VSSNSSHGPAPDYRELRRIAEQAARAAGEVARGGFGKPISYDLKQDRSEVSQFDHAAEEAAVEAIRKHRPQDALIGEESAGNGSGPRARTSADPLRVTWAIDPIDGTRNFVRGVPVFCSSVAAIHNGYPVAGAIYDPLRDEMFAADRDSGAMRNAESLPRLDKAESGATERQSDEAGKPVRTFPRSHLPTNKRPRPIIAIPGVLDEQLRRFVTPLMGRCVLENLGSAALHMALVAAGCIDAAIAHGKLWDVAAGWLLVTQVGGMATDPAGDPLFPIDVAAYRNDEMPSLAARLGLHAELLRPAT